MTQPITITPSDSWKQSHPGASIGILVLKDVENPPLHPQLEKRKNELQEEIKARFSDDSALESLPVIQAYSQYYKHFKKTYHVLLQLQSIAFKGRSIPSAAGLVEAMFMAELEDGLLTAGHDLDSLALPLVIDSANGTEQYTLLRGTGQELKAGDMYIRDGLGIISSILYGPDQRTPIHSLTHSALFAVYAPAPIDRQTVIRHLGQIRTYVHLISPQAETACLEVITA